MPKKLRPAVDLMAFKCRTLKVNLMWLLPFCVQRSAYPEGAIHGRRNQDMVSVNPLSIAQGMCRYVAHVDLLLRMAACCLTPR
jgi:hypothetical protein